MFDLKSLLLKLSTVLRVLVTRIFYVKIILMKCKTQSKIFRKNIVLGLQKHKHICSTMHFVIIRVAIMHNMTMGQNRVSLHTLTILI